MHKLQNSDSICSIISEAVLKDKTFKDFMHIMAKHSIDFPHSGKLDRFKDAFAEFIRLHPESFKDG